MAEVWPCTDSYVLLFQSTSVLGKKDPRPNLGPSLAAEVWILQFLLLG